MARRPVHDRAREKTEVLNPASRIVQCQCHRAGPTMPPYLSAAHRCHSRSPHLLMWPAVGVDIGRVVGELTKALESGGRTHHRGSTGRNRKGCLSPLFPAEPSCRNTAVLLVRCLRALLQASGMVPSSIILSLTDEERKIRSMEK